MSIVSRAACRLSMFSGAPFRLESSAAGILVLGEGMMCSPLDFHLVNYGLTSCCGVFRTRLLRLRSTALGEIELTCSITILD
jgi:hypothetical protein